MHILFVEDELELFGEFIENLRKKGETVDTLENGDMALQFALDYHGEYDLIILDSTLPKLDGGKVCKSIRDAGIDIPILMLVTQEDMEERKDIFECGASDYLVKPFTAGELLLRVSALMERQEVFAPVVITSGDVTLNILDRTIEKEGTIVSLTSKELALTEYLMRNPGRTISRHELWRELWKEGSAPKSNIVNAHVKNVRKKIQAVQGKHQKVHIETIRGLGYRLKS